VVDVPKLYNLKHKGYTPETIALVLGVTIETVRTILGALEDPSPSWWGTKEKRIERCA